MIFLISEICLLRWCHWINPKKKKNQYFSVIGKKDLRSSVKWKSGKWQWQDPIRIINIQIMMEALNDLCHNSIYWSRIWSLWSLNFQYTKLYCIWKTYTKRIIYPKRQYIFVVNFKSFFSPTAKLNQNSTA